MYLFSVHPKDILARRHKLPIKIYLRINANIILITIVTSNNKAGQWWILFV